MARMRAVSENKHDIIINHHRRRLEGSPAARNSVEVTKTVPFRIDIRTHVIHACQFQPAALPATVTSIPSNGEEGGFPKPTVRFAIKTFRQA
ncbi:hypothetical protein ZHAS_00018536 [Anopheles sinensis]|uniref:Uncharacterized protein n=1 Tax=Anopheles sinensis TaxID=74873 RepID=A0A084WJV4_ANOSI|nr:hypothetical protein ZHAS_00018536 [Anopheles sinensis]